MKNRTKLPRANFGRDPNNKGHYFFSINHFVDQCDNCGCQYGVNYEKFGFLGGKPSAFCREQPWKCDGCGNLFPYAASGPYTWDALSSFCLNCASKIKELI